MAGLFLDTHWHLPKKGRVRTVTETGPLAVEARSHVLVQPAIDDRHPARPDLNRVSHLDASGVFRRNASRIPRERAPPDTINQSSRVQT